MNSKDNPVSRPKRKPPKLSSVREKRKRRQSRVEAEVKARVKKELVKARAALKRQLMAKRPCTTKIPYQLYPKLAYWHEIQKYSYREIASLLLRAYGISVSHTTVRYHVLKAVSIEKALNQQNQETR